MPMSTRSPLRAAHAAALAGLLALPTLAWSQSAPKTGWTMPPPPVWRARSCTPRC